MYTSLVGFHVSFSSHDVCPPWRPANITSELWRTSCQFVFPYLPVNVFSSGALYIQYIMWWVFVFRKQPLVHTHGHNTLHAPRQYSYHIRYFPRLHAGTHIYVCSCCAPKKHNELRVHTSTYTYPVPGTSCNMHTNTINVLIYTWYLVPGTYLGPILTLLEPQSPFGDTLV